ncbi:CRTAC1 family protein [Fodinibius sp.]|uniref:CRTAC1 family protein n=1 Tax=Fodinibius sp. TaxID=1872440 RepID=UPI003566363A
MFSKLSRRKRRILGTSLPIAVVSILAAFFIWQQQDTTKYIPGDEIEGRTARLDREIPEDVPQIRFDNVTEQKGIEFNHFYKERGSRITEDMGSGVAWIDFNNDGYEDLFVVNFAGPTDMENEAFNNSPATPVLYQNNGDDSFTDVTEQAGLKIPVYGMGTAWADYDNDGYIDCLVTTYGQNRLFNNNGNSTFTEVSAEAGLTDKKGFWSGAAWADYNGDGFVDLYIGGYVSYFEIPDEEEIRALQEPPSINPSVFDPAPNLLYKNNGDGTFSEVSEEAGVANPEGKSLAVAWVDLTNNNLPDLYVANDVTDNMLYQNLGDGTFINISYQAKVADYRGSMGIAIGDWNGDQDYDLFITHWVAEENAFYNNTTDSRGTLEFRDEADRLGMGQASTDYVGWATSFVDLENDGREDLFTVNGHTMQKTGTPREIIPMKDRIFWNRNNEEGFYDISGQAGEYFRAGWVGRGGAYGDYNNDGLQDLFIVNHNAPAVLLENQTPSENRWLQLRLEGTESNKSAIGTKIRLTVDDEVQIRQVGMQPSYLSQNTLIQQFGLGKAGKADTLFIRWPSGEEQVFTNVNSNQRLHIREGDAELRVLN